MHTFRRSLAPRLLAAACAAACVSGVSAQERNSPYYIGVTQTFTHDSNVYRTATAEVTETISTTGVLLGMDQHFGRQRVFVDGRADVNRYRQAKELNNKGYTLRTGLDWETIETLSGTLRYTRNNALAELGSSGVGQEVSDVVTDQFSVTGRYGMPSKVALDLGYDHRKVNYGSPLLAARNQSQDTVNAGLLWGVGGQLTLGFGGRITRGITPEASPAPPYEDKLRRRDIDLTIAWVASGFSTFNARLSHTDETRSLSSSAAITGLTGMVTWTYRPTGRTNLSASLVRDTGSETTFISTTPEGTGAQTVDNNRLSTVLALNANYALTAKTSLGGNARYRRGTLATQDREAVNAYEVSLRYIPTRTLTLNCSIGRESRSVTGVQGYDATITACSAELALR